MISKEEFEDMAKNSKGSNDLLSKIAPGLFPPEVLRGMMMLYDLKEECKVLQKDA